MANVSITNLCNKKCEYCFAGDVLEEFGSTHMENTVYESALRYLKRSGMNQVRLLGGEPTLHPHFTQFVNTALEQGFHILIFTNGLINHDILDFLHTIPDNRLSILLNTIHPNENNPHGIARQCRTMQVLKSKIAVGVNIFSSGQDLYYLLDYVNKFGLKNEIRLGLSHQVLSKKNSFLHPKDYQKIGAKIAQLKSEGIKQSVKIGFDCGFVPCMFPQDSVELLMEELHKAGNCCHPIIDLLTDGSFIACYPLNSFRKILIDDHVTASDLIGNFEEKLAPYQVVGIFPQCSSCPIFHKRCNGGCMSFRIQRFYNNSKETK